MANVEAAMESKPATETSETVEKLVEAMGVNALNGIDQKEKAEIVSEYVKKTIETYYENQKARMKSGENF